MNLPVSKRLAFLLGLVGLQAHITIERAPGRGAGRLSASDEEAARNAMRLFNGEEPFDKCTRGEARKGQEVVFLFEHVPVTGSVLETAGPTVAVAVFKDHRIGEERAVVIQQDAFDVWHTVKSWSWNGDQRDEALAHARGMPKKARFGANMEQVDLLPAMGPGDMQATIKGLASIISTTDGKPDKRTPKEVLEGLWKALQRVGAAPTQPLSFVEPKQQKKNERAGAETGSTAAPDAIADAKVVGE